jgi:hypothetical protein
VAAGSRTGGDESRLSSVRETAQGAPQQFGHGSSSSIGVHFTNYLTGRLGKSGGCLAHSHLAGLVDQLGRRPVQHGGDGLVDGGARPAGVISRPRPSAAREPSQPTRSKTAAPNPALPNAHGLEPVAHLSALHLPGQGSHDPTTGRTHGMAFGDASHRHDLRRESALGLRDGSASSGRRTRLLLAWNPVLPPEVLRSLNHPAGNREVLPACRDPPAGQGVVEQHARARTGTSALPHFRSRTDRARPLLPGRASRLRNHYLPGTRRRRGLPTRRPPPDGRRRRRAGTELWRVHLDTPRAGEARAATACRRAEMFSSPLPGSFRAARACTR